MLTCYDSYNFKQKKMYETYMSDFLPYNLPLRPVKTHTFHERLDLPITLELFYCILNASQCQ